MDTEFSSFQQESWIKFDNESESSAQPKLDAESKDAERSKPEYDLVNFLAVVQAMEIPILPIKWHASLKTVGRGGSGSIWEAHINAKTSLAFKRVSDSLKMEVKSASDEQERRRLKASIFQTLINEVTVLSHPKLRRHPNILELQGMCWDVEEDEVWPVLVFEKAQFGDLERFLTSPASKALTADERLSLCIDVGRALIDMDSYGFIHGDVKPENVLVFEDDSDAPETVRFVARLADFGYSSKIEDEGENVLLPRTWPWNDPEHCFRNAPAAARKMELYSFGVLCLWVMLEQHLSKPSKLPQNVSKIRKNINEYHMRKKKTGRDPRKEFLGDLGSLGDLDMAFQKLNHMVRSVILKENLLNIKNQQPLVYFFNDTFRSSNRRALDLSKAFSGFRRRWPHSRPSKTDDNYDMILSERRFEVLLSLQSLYQSDYCVRSQIRYCLEQKLSKVVASTSSDRQFAFQLALFHSIGFGGARCDAETKENLLLGSTRSREELCEAVDLIHGRELKDTGSRERYGTVYKELLRQGHVQSADVTEDYRTSGRLDEAEREIRQEILLAGREPEDSRIVTMLMHSLSAVLSVSGRWDEAEQLQVQISKAYEKIHGPESPVTLKSKADLVSLYIRQGKWKAAEELGFKVVEARKRVCGLTHSDTMASIKDLALTYREQRQWKPARRVDLKVMTNCRRKLGLEHPLMLDCMTSLASTHLGQGRWDEAEELQSQVVEIRKRVFGPLHFSTMKSIRLLKRIYLGQERWDKAQELDVYEAETRVRLLSPQDRSLHACIMDLIQSYRKQGWKEKAIELETLVIAAKVPLPRSEDLSLRNRR